MINIIYLFLWGVPLYYFIRDFFIFTNIRNFFDISLLEILKFSITQSLYSVALAFIVAIIPAYYISYKDNLLSRVLNSLVFIPFFFPVISLITVFSIVFNFGILKEFNILYTLKAILFANVFYNSPILLKSISNGIKSIPIEIEEAMELEGASKFQIFFYGQLPMIFPQILRGCVLVFTYCFLNFAIILGLGGIKFSTLESEIGSLLLGSTDFSKAMFLGILQFLILLVLNTLISFVPEYEIINKSKKRNLPIIFKMFSIIYCILQYSVIILAILFSFFNIFNGEFTLVGYKNLFFTDILYEYNIIKSLVNSIILSLIVSFFVIIFTYLIIKNYNRLTGIIIFANLGISGAFLGVVLYYLNILFNIPLTILLMIGYLLSTIPIAYSFIYQYIKKFPIEIIESSKLDCINNFQKWIYIEFPILKRLLISSFLQIFAIIFGEFTLGYTMQIESYLPIVSITNYNLLSNKLYLESSAFSTILLLIIFIVFLLGEWIKDEYNKR